MSNLLLLLLRVDLMRGAGEVYNPSSGLCLDKSDSVDMIGEVVDLVPCHGDAGNQYW